MNLTKILAVLRKTFFLGPPFKGPKGPLATRSEPSALKGWILEVLCCNPKGGRAFLRILSTEGRGVRLCWAASKPKELTRNGRVHCLTQIHLI